MHACHNRNYYHPHQYESCYPQPGLADLAGGVIGLAAMVLHGGSRIAHRIVNGAAWSGCCEPYQGRRCCGHSCHAAHHSCVYFECRPSSCHFI